MNVAKQSPVLTEHHEAEQRLLSLSPTQALAVEALAAGSTHAEAASAAGVARETVSRWAKHHPGFQASLNLHREALGVEQADRLQRIGAKALVVIEAALDEGDRATATVVLRVMAGARFFQPDSRPTDPAEILDAEISRLRITLPPPVPVRDAHGWPDPLAMLTAEEPAERARRIALTRLTAATTESTG
jgi:hypothetical protein